MFKKCLFYIAISLLLSSAGFALGFTNNLIMVPNNNLFNIGLGGSGADSNGNTVVTTQQQSILSDGQNITVQNETTVVSSDDSPFNFFMGLQSPLLLGQGLLLLGQSPLLLGQSPLLLQGFPSGLQLHLLMSGL